MHERLTSVCPRDSPRPSMRCYPVESAEAQGFLLQQDGQDRVRLRGIRQSGIRFDVNLNRYWDEQNLRLCNESLVWMSKRHTAPKLPSRYGVRIGLHYPKVPARLASESLAKM